MPPKKKFDDPIPKGRDKSNAKVISVGKGKKQLEKSPV